MWLKLKIGGKELKPNSTQFVSILTVKSAGVLVSEWLSCHNLFHNTGY
jgi:hypothetical protein